MKKTINTPTLLLLFGVFFCSLFMMESSLGENLYQAKYDVPSLDRETRPLNDKSDSIVTHEGTANFSTNIFVKNNDNSPKILVAGDSKLNISPNLECTQTPRVNPTPQGSAENFSFADIQHESIEWVRNDKPYFDRHFTSDVIWCRVALRNESANHFRWFFVLDSTRLNFVNFYWQTNKNGTAPSQTSYAGDHRPTVTGQSSIDLITALPTFEMVVSPNDEGILYFAIDTDSVIWLSASIYSGKSYGAMANFRHLWQWLYAAIVAACILLQLVLTRTSIGRTEAYYILAVTSGLFYMYCFFGDANHWLGLQSGEVKNDILFILTFGYLFFGLLFVKNYLCVKQLSPWLESIFLLQCLFVLVGWVLIFNAYEINQHRVQVAASLTILSGLVILLGTYMALRRGLSGAWGLMITWSLISLSGMASSLLFIGVIPFNGIISRSVLWLFPLDVIVLSSFFVFQHLRYRKELQHLRVLLDHQRVETLEVITPEIIEEKPEFPATQQVTLGNKQNDHTNKSRHKTSHAEKRLQGIDCDQKIKLLVERLEREKMYCREDISLINVAEVLDLRADQVSALLNHKLGTSFSTFINEYRIKEAKELLQKSPNQSVIDIAIHSGFNSRTSFNRVFKMHTQMSPVEFRKKYSE